MKMFCSDWSYLIRNHLSFLFIDFVFQIIYCKTNFTAKNGSDLCNFYSKLVLGNFLLGIIFLIFSIYFKLLTFHNNIVTVSEILNKGNSLKTRIQTTYPIDLFCIICSHFYYRKIENFDFLKTTERNKTFLCIFSYSKRFCIESWQNK